MSQLITGTEVYTHLTELLDLAIRYSSERANGREYYTAAYERYVQKRKQFRDLLLPFYRSEQSAAWVFKDGITLHD